MKYLNTQDADFQAELQALLAFETAQDPKIDQIVADICADVQQRGDAAQQHAIGEWLGHVVVGAELEAHDLVDLLALRGQEEHRRALVPAPQLAPAVSQT